MNDQLYLLLDGELSDSETVEVLRTLISNSRDRALFSAQLRLQGALGRNDGHAGMNPSEEADMLSRVSLAIGASPSRPPNRRRGIGSAAFALAVVALVLGTLVGYSSYGALNGTRGIGPRTTPITAAPASMAPAPAPCNCDSAVAAATSAREAPASTKPAPAAAPRRNRNVTHRHQDRITTGANEARLRAGKTAH